MTREARLGEFLAKQSRGIVPNAIPEAAFELYSVPSFDQRMPEIVKGAAIGSNKQIVDTGTVLLCKINPRINRAWTVGSFSSHPKIASTEWITFPPSDQLEPKYLAYFLQKNSVRDYLAANASGVGGSLMRVKPSTVEDLRFPLRPLRCQRQTVAEIEKQFSRLDEAIANLQRVKANLARYHTATLSSAVEGKLLAGLPGRPCGPDGSAAALLREVVSRRQASWTGKYERPTDPTPPTSRALPRGWVWASVSQLMAERIVNGLSVRESSEVTEVRALRLNAMTSRGFDFSAFRHLPVEPDAVEDIVIRAGDFFVSRGNGSLELVGRGTVAQAPPARFIFPDTMMRIRFTAAVPVMPWIAMLWPSRLVREQIEARVKTTAGIYKIAQPQLASITIPFPPLAEQCRIVAEVDRRLSIVRGVKAEVDANLIRVQALRQAVLARAFGGDGLASAGPANQAAGASRTGVEAPRQPVSHP